MTAGLCRSHGRRKWAQQHLQERTANATAREYTSTERWEPVIKERRISSPSEYTSTKHEHLDLVVAWAWTPQACRDPAGWRGGDETVDLRWRAVGCTQQPAGNRANLSAHVGQCGDATHPPTDARSPCCSSVGVEFDTPCLQTTSSHSEVQTPRTGPRPLQRAPRATSLPAQCGK